MLQIQVPPGNHPKTLLVTPVTITYQPMLFSYLKFSLSVELFGPCADHRDRVVISICPS